MSTCCRGCRLTPRDTALAIAGGVDEIASNFQRSHQVDAASAFRTVTKSKTLRVLVDRFSAGRADFHCREFIISEFQHVSRLAARHRAGVIISPFGSSV